MSIASEPKHCPKCGGPIPAEAPQGLCPKCLLLQASLPTEAGKGASFKSAPPTQKELSAAFPQLEILELIGQGGMGFVFKARQPKLDRFVALKILPQSLAADPAFAERFSREGRMLARLNHPNIVTIHDFGQANGFFYLLMEFVDGVNLRQAMKVGRFTPAQALAIVPKICEALQFAHNEGILHRDIKPENILLDSKGRVKIADFGIAKLVGGEAGRAGSPLPAADARGDDGAHGVTRPTGVALTETGKVLGTPNYMAPEQLEHPQDVDQRADIYSLGVVFYEMLTGELPLGKFAPPSRKVQVDVRLDEVVLRALEREPELRYQQASQVKTAVETIATTSSASVPPAEPGVAPGLTKEEAEKLGRDIGAVFTPKGFVLFARKTLLLFTDQALLLFDFTANVAPFVERKGRRRFNFWPILLLFCSTIGFLVNGGILVITRVWHVTSPHGNIFALSIQEQQMLIWMAISAVGRLAALNLGSNNVAGTERDQAAKRITARRIRVVCRRLLLLAALMVGGTLVGKLLVAAAEATNGQSNIVRVAWWIGLTIAVYLFMKVVVWFVRFYSRVWGEVNKINSDSAKSKGLPAVEAWLAILDGGNYAQSWETASAYFQRTISKEEWEGRLERVRRPLGEVLSRKFNSIKRIAAGTRFEAKFDTVFDGLLVAVETVTFALQPSGEWKAIGYLIRPAGHEVPRFSRTAIVGVCFGILGLLALVLYAIIGDSNMLDEGPSNVLAALTALCLLISTILGWVAVSQIRRWAPKLHGMWLAVSDGLLFPLLALDGLLAFQASTIVQTFSAMDAVFAQLGIQPASDERFKWLAGIATVFICVVANTLIAWGVWRAVNKRSADVPPADSENSTFGKWACGPLVVVTLGPSLLMTIVPWQEGLAEGLAAALGSVALALALVWGLISWRKRLGKFVVIATSALFVALIVVAAVFSLVIVPAKRVRLQAAFGPVTECTLPMDEDGWTPLFDLDHNQPVFVPKPSGPVTGMVPRLLQLKKAGVAIRHDNQAHIIVFWGTSGTAAGPAPGDQWNNITDMEELATVWEGIGPDKNQTFDYPDTLPQAIFFKTGAGKLGLLQITGFTENPRGVKIRYKLVQSPATAPQLPLGYEQGQPVSLPPAYQRGQAPPTPPAYKLAQDPAPTRPLPPAPAKNLIFGPVIERVISTTQRDTAFLNLTTGEFVNAPKEMTPGEWRGGETLWKQVAESQIDLMAATDNGYPRTVHCYMELVDESDKAWDEPARLTPQAVALLRNTPRGPRPVVLASAGNLPATLAFHTARGTAGLLQTLGYTDDLRGVKIRYKLVQNAQATAATPPSPARGDGPRLQGQPEGMAALNSPPRNVLRFRPAGHVAVLAYSPDGKTLAVGGDRAMVSLLDATTAKPITTLKLFSAEEETVLAEVKRVLYIEVRTVAFSPDSTVLAVGNSLGQVKLFDARTGALMLSLDDVTGRSGNNNAADKLLALRRAVGNVWAIAFSPDGSMLATSGDPIYAETDLGRSNAKPISGNLKLWDARTGALKRDLAGHHNQVVDAAFSPDGKFLASAGIFDAPRSQNGVKLWDPQTGKLVRAIPVSGSALSLAFSPDGRRIAIGTMQYDKGTDVTSGSINVAYAASGILDLTWLVPVSVRPVAFSPDGKTIAARSGKDAVTLWNYMTGKPEREIRPSDKRDGERWEHFAFSPRANVLAIGGVDAENRGFVDLWDLGEQHQ